MRMIPDSPYQTRSTAERRTFDRLRAAFSGPDRRDLVGFHSLTLTRHARKRFGEIDFLICGREGIYVLEVKGGRVACQNGVWRYTNRYDEISESREGPFRQAELALHGLMDSIRAHLPSQVYKQFVIGFGVVFPQCEWRVKGAEWDPATVADERAFRDFESWLFKLFRYWRSKAGSPEVADERAVRDLREFLRPEFEAVAPLHILSGEAEEQVVQLTDDQMAFVDVVAENPRVLCSGGAGTGKTFLAMELARRWTGQGKNVLLACRSAWLRRYLETRFVIPGLSTALIDSLELTMGRSGVVRFDALIVDEGQDIFDMDSLDRLDKVLLGGLADGSWCIFHDTNNQAGLVGRADPDAVQYLSSLRPSRVPLRTNCRNTRFILETVQQTLGADMGVRGVGVGPKVRRHVADGSEEGAALLARELEEFVDRGGLAPGHVTILSPESFEKSSAALLPEKTRRSITVLDEYSLRGFPPERVNFTQIANFKGLENEAVIVIDLAEPEGRRPEELSQYYVAMSRPRAVLSMIFRKGWG